MATLVIGDLLSLALLTVVGFASHDQLALAALPRMLATFFPLTLGWFLLAPALGLFRAEEVRSGAGLWRAALAAFFAAQLAVILRGVWLHAAVQPLFGLVLGATSAVGMALWRVIVGRWKRF